MTFFWKLKYTPVAFFD